MRKLLSLQGRTLTDRVANRFRSDGDVLRSKSSFGVHLCFWTVSSAAADARARAELAAHLQGCLPAGEAQALAVRVPQS